MAAVQVVNVQHFFFLTFNFALIPGDDWHISCKMKNNQTY